MKIFDTGKKYLIRGIVGEPGVGKSCVLQQIINSYYKNGVNVWSTREFTNAMKISIEDLGVYDFNINGVQGGVLILDELGIDLNNRNFKEIPRNILEFFKLYRHFKLDIFVVSQGIDIDITVRRLVNKWYKLKRVIIPIIGLKTNYVNLWEVDNNLTIDNGDWKLEYTIGRIVQTYNISKSFKYFDSFSLPANTKHFDTPYYSLNIDTAKPLSKPKKIYSLFSRLKARFTERGVRLSAGEEVHQDYNNLSREELLDLWKKNLN